MFEKLTLKNFGPLKDIQGSGLGPINLVIGENGTGKTFLLKSIYTAMRTIEEYKRGDDQRTASEILAEKLYWTFQSDKIGDLVNKESNSPLVCSLTLDAKEFRYEFGRDTTKKIVQLESHVSPRSSNTAFLPAKEVLSLHQSILKSRDQDQIFEFDDTYLDLARALLQPTQLGKNYKELANSRTSLHDMLGGKITFDDKSRRWVFKKGKQKFPLGVTSEGTKKIPILDTLLGNRYLGPDSIVLIDEPESALHPTAVSQLLDILSLLAEQGIQFFLASHSYFVIKKLYLLAQEKQISLPVLAANARGDWTQANLQKGMVTNSIIDESIHLYEQEVGMSLK